MFGRRATLPIDLETSRTTPEEKAEKYERAEEGDPDEKFVNREKQLEEAKANILVAQKKQKDYDRKHANPERYHIGALVLKKNFLRKKKKGGKLDERFTGAYKIVKILPNGVYLIESVEDPSKVVRVTGAHLKPYNIPEEAPADPEEVESSPEDCSGDSSSHPHDPGSPLDDSVFHSDGPICPATDSLSPPAKRQKLNSFSSVESFGSPAHSSSPINKGSLHSKGNTKSAAIDADKPRCTRQRDSIPWGAPSLNLDEDDRDDILQEKWLSDKHIRASSKLLNTMYPTQAGLLDPVNLIPRCSSEGSADFVQILHINQCHWVCASNIACPPATVDVFDSMSSSSVGSKVLQKQLAALARCPERQLLIRHVEVQQQEGASDCGLFAIAFAQSLCDGVDPHALSLDQSKMRTHLLECFEDGEMVPFPPAPRSRRLRRRIRRVEKVAVYCLCRLPWDKHDQVNGSLAQCRKCKEWFHARCANIPETIFVERDSIWFCPRCSL